MNRTGASIEPATHLANPRAWLLVALLSATATASYLCRVNVSVAGDLLMREFGLSQVQMGRVFSAFLLGYALFQVPAGMLADRFGARRVLAGAALWWVAGTALLASVGAGPLQLSAGAALTAFLVLRLVLGIGEAPTFPAAAQGISRWIPPTSQGKANGMVVAAIGLGSALAPPLITAVMVRWGWRASLLVSAVPALGVALAWLAVKAPAGSPSEARASASAFVGSEAGSATPPAGARAAPPANGPIPPHPTLFTRSFALLTASYTLQGYVGYIFVFWFYLYLIQVRHFDLLRGALFGSLPWMLSIVSIPLGGIVSDRLVAGRLGARWGRRAVPMCGLIAAGGFLSLGAHTANQYLAAVVMALATALVLSSEGPFWATMTAIAGGRAGTGGGTMNMGSNLGGLISPALTPALAVIIGWENALHVAAAVSVLAGLLWLGVCPPAIKQLR